MKKTFLILVLLVAVFMTSCISYLGPVHLPVNGTGDNRYIDYGGIRYSILPEESQKGGYWYSADGDNTVFIGRSKQRFYEWIDVTSFYLYDNGKGVSYIHGSPYYYFPEWITGFPELEAANIDELIVGDARIADREIIEAFFALQYEAAKFEDAPFDSLSPWIVNGREIDRITAYNIDFDLVRPFLIYTYGDSVLVPVFRQPGYKHTKMPDDLAERIISYIN